MCFGVFPITSYPSAWELADPPAPQINIARIGAVRPVTDGVLGKIPLSSVHLSIQVRYQAVES